MHQEDEWKDLNSFKMSSVFFFLSLRFFSQFGCNPSKDNLRHLFQFFWQYSVLSFDEKFYEAPHLVWSLQLDILTLKADNKSLPSPQCGWSCCCRCGCWWWPRLSPWSCPPSSPPPPPPPPQCCPGPRISSACFALYWSHSYPYSLDSREPAERKWSDTREERGEIDISLWGSASSALYLVFQTWEVSCGPLFLV